MVVAYRSHNVTRHDEVLTREWGGFLGWGKKGHFHLLGCHARKILSEADFRLGVTSSPSAE